MDFSQQYGFPQPYQSFVTVPPLTPSHSHSTASDDYNNTSPPETFDNLDSLPPADQFTGFDFNPGFNAHQQNPRFPGPPTPPNHGLYGANQAQQSQHEFLPHDNAGESVLKSLRDSSASQHDGDSAGQGRAGSEDDDSLTPAQSRRKAQNRAAQRAFRERKEKHVKDLETKLASLEAAQQHAHKENERLRRDLQKMATENEILRATTAVSGSANQHESEPTTTGPMTYNPSDFYSNVLQDHSNKHPSHRIVTSDSGERLLAAGAAWDFIISHDLFKRGLVNVGDVSDRLKSCARCDGQGPVFSENAILAAMQQSIASGTDDLL
ncbi:hypothetical protein B0I35DRAFT_409629 [Stachybotrys elegans]|uniref:BZIP domain-containing protein n=1 Tax=Stachybotrys elegans TaxID=80388 RepID=A0A8K0SPH8_9HYPO|nr:hypothetical protein B0I35DRAFT_409629 [Stachybotrys elegans]